MRLSLHHKIHRRPERPAWAPLLVLGLSVMASVVLIGTCMTMLWPESEADPARLSRAPAGNSVR